MKILKQVITIIATVVLMSFVIQPQPSESATSVTLKQFQTLSAQVNKIQSSIDSLVGQLSDIDVKASDVKTKNETLISSLKSATSQLDALQKDYESLKNGTQTLAKTLLAKVESSIYQVECAGALGSAWGVSIQFRADDVAAGYQGAVVTNYHVVSSCLGGNVRVSQNGRTLGGKVSSWDQANDLALIKTVGTTNALVVSTVAPARGDFAMTLGSPYGLEGSVSQGIVSNMNGDFVVTDAAIDPGNSGGPLLNSKGELIGINTWKYVGSQGSGNSIKPGVICRQILICSVGSNFLSWSK